MSCKVVGVTRPIYELCMVLQKFEDDIDFTVFYSFSEILSSYHYCPAFTFDGVYYEIQYDEQDNLGIVDFGVDGRNEMGDVLTLEQIIKLVENIREYYGK